MRKLSNTEIKRIRNLARTMKLADVAKVTGWSQGTVDRYAKGIRPQRRPKITRPNHPCPSCSSIRVVSNGRKSWGCMSCGRYWRKQPVWIRVSLREHNHILQLRKQGKKIREIAVQVQRGRGTVIHHLQGRVVPIS